MSEESPQWQGDSSSQARFLSAGILSDVRRIKTQKHEKLCIKPKNDAFKNDFGNSENIIEAFDNKCREIRELKKLNHEYKNELELYFI